MKFWGGFRLRRLGALGAAMLLSACSLHYPFADANADQPIVNAATPPQPVIQVPPPQQIARLPGRPIAKPAVPILRSMPPRLEITGHASWYGIPFHGRLTANGEVYDMNSLSAAHKTLPFGTRVRVHNLDNGSSLVLRINDRGPFVEGRVIDVSRRAARLLGFQHAGLANVLIVLEPPKQTASLNRRKNN